MLQQQQQQQQQQQPQQQQQTLSSELCQFMLWVDQWNQHHNQFKLDPADLLKYFIDKNVMNSPLSMQTNSNIITQQAVILNNDDCSNLRTTEPLSTITEGKETNFLSAEAVSFIPSPPPPPKMINKMINKTKFIPKYPARAQLNIYIAKHMTSNLLNMIYEEFPSPETLYYYIDISTALQINDEQIYVFNIDGNKKVVFVHYDLHKNDATKQVLYGVITQNEGHAVKQNKWLWKLDEFMNADDIYLNFGVCMNDLPVSSRKMVAFQKQLELGYNLAININKKIIFDTDWMNIQQIKSLRRGECKRNKNKNKNKNKVQIVIKCPTSQWIEECIKSWNDFPAIPIVVNENKKINQNENKHWVEWVKLVCIDNKRGNKVYVGISCKYVTDKKKWIITSICLDKGDIQNKHRLIGLYGDNKQRYIQYFNQFNTTFTEIQWIKNL